MELEEATLHLLLGLLDKSPENRMTAQEVLDHDWFKNARPQHHKPLGSTPNYGTMSDKSSSSHRT